MREIPKKHGKEGNGKRSGVRTVGVGFEDASFRKISINLSAILPGL